MAVATDQFNRLEDRVNSTTEKVNELKGAYEHLATGKDVEKTNTSIEALKSWILWRVLVGAAIIQGIIAAGIKYLP